MSKDQNPPESDSQDPEFMKKFQKTIESYASAVEGDDQSAATEAAFAALALAGMEAMSNPTPDLLLAEEAHKCESARDWAGAEAAYRKLLAMHEASGNPRFIVKPQLDLSNLFRLLGRLDEAWEFACAASGTGRKADMFTLLTMALDNEAACALDRADVPRALAAASEAVEIIEPGKIFNSLRARALTRRAECWLAQGALQNAEEDLRQSWELFQTKVRIFGIGLIGAIAHWWEVKAKSHLLRQETAEAKSAYQQAIQYRQQVMEGFCAPNPYAAASLLRVQDKLAETSK
jgi:tetratricopeptide (TPR) repeat protein